MKRKLFRFTIFMLTAMAIISIGACRKKPEPANLIITVEGEEFSNAVVSIDGAAAGRLTQTLITADGELYIDGVHSATLTSSEEGEGAEAREEDECSGMLDSLVLAPGSHTIVLQDSEGKNLEIKVNVTPGYHQLTYFPDEGTVKWDNKSSPGTAGATITIR